MRTVALGEIAEIKGGGTPDKAIASYWGGDIPWASVKDFKTTELSITEDFITELGVQKSATHIIPAGSIIVPTRMAVGKAAINTVDMAINQDLKAIFPKPEVDSRYLLYALLAQSSELERQATGATVKGIKLEVLRTLNILVPPLEEQKRIAAILDQADALRLQRQRALDGLNQLGQSIFYEMFGDPTSNRLNWKVKQLKDVVREGTIVTYGIVQAGKEFEGGVPYIRTGDIADGEIIEQKLRRTNPAIAAKYTRSRVSTGDIVMSIRATVGTTALVPPSLDGANLTQGTARISPGADTERDFLLNYLRCAHAQSWIHRQVKGATFREITLTKLRELPVIVPPMKLQREFTLKIHQVTSLIREMKHQLEGAETLFRSLQFQFLSGRAA